MKKCFYSFTAMTLIFFAKFADALNITPPSGVSQSTDLDSALMSLINKILAIVGSLAILMIIIAGIMYITSGGESSKAENAKNLLTYSIIGLVVVLLSYVIVYFISEALGAN